MESWESCSNVFSCLPLDVALKIASSLSDKDVCALGSCSRFWREVCRSDSIWISLSRKRWPSLFPHSSQVVVPPRDSDPLTTNWKGFYWMRYRQMKAIATSAITFLDQCIAESNSIEECDCYKVQDQLASVQFGFADVESFFFNSEVSEFVNFVGLGYAMKRLDVPIEVATSAIARYNLYDRMFGRFNADTSVSDSETDSE